jgi:hypothetical protein
MINNYKGQKTKLTNVNQQSVLINRSGDRFNK